VDSSLIVFQMRRAAEARHALAAVPGLTCYRLANAEADGLPGLTADRFGDAVVLSLYRELSGAEEAAVLDAAVAAWGPRAVYVKRRPREARVLSNTARAEVSPALPSRGVPVDSCVVEENGLRFGIRPGAGLSVGLFLDMREARAWVRAHAAGKSVLNTFSYTCGFSVAARVGGASRALNVDASRRVLDWGEDNHRLNGSSGWTRRGSRSTWSSWTRRRLPPRATAASARRGTTRTWWRRRPRSWPRGGRCSPAATCPGWPLPATRPR